MTCRHVETWLGSEEPGEEHAWLHTERPQTGLTQTILLRGSRVPHLIYSLFLKCILEYCSIMENTTSWVTLIAFLYFTPRFKGLHKTCLKTLSLWFTTLWQWYHKNSSTTYLFKPDDSQCLESSMSPIMLLYIHDSSMWVLAAVSPAMSHTLIFSGWLHNYDSGFTPIASTV